MICGKPGDYPTGKEETTVGAVQPTERHTTKGEVREMKDLTMEQTRDAYYCEATTQVRINASEFHADHTRLLIQRSNLDS